MGLLRLEAYRYPAYLSPQDPTADKPNLFPQIQPPYKFDAPKMVSGLSADFNGSGYNSLAFGFLEIAYSAAAPFLSHRTT